jgi:putative ABC transport system permease protein
MKLTALFAESFTSMRSRVVPSIMIALLVAAMCVITLITVGRTAAGEREVEAQLTEAGSRHLIISDAKDLGFISEETVRTIADLSSVDNVLGLSVPIDVSNRAVGSGNLVPAWQVTGNLPESLTLQAGRWPQPGEGLISDQAADALGMDAPFGAVTPGRNSASVSVVGSFVAPAPYSQLNDGVIVAASDGQAVHSLDILIGTAGAAQATEQAVTGVLARTDPSDLRIQSPRTLADVQTAVLGGIGQTNRSIAALVLGGGAMLVAIVTLSDVLLHRADLGRRRALGATRWVLTSLVVIRTLLAGVIGAALGTLGATIAMAATGESVDLSFAVGVTVLSVLAAVASAIPPAAIAAFQDPVRVLRTP